MQNNRNYLITGARHSPNPRSDSQHIPASGCGDTHSGPDFRDCDVSHRKEIIQ
jgi:hypothetical protein